MGLASHISEMSDSQLNSDLHLLGINRVQINVVSCSNKHAAALTNTGSVYTWGENQYSQLGYSTQEQMYSSTPKRVDPLKSFIT